MLVLVGPSWALAEGVKETELCTAPEHSQFDFWVGEWSVTDGEGKVVGTNTIEKILDGFYARK